MRYRLITLSPIHIGNAMEITSWNYLYDDKNKQISIYSTDKLVSEFGKHQNLIDNLRDTIEMQVNKKSLKEVFEEFSIKIDPDYTIPFSGSIKKGDEYKNIKEFIKQTGKVYIPGSEIKGAIRTALLYTNLVNNYNGSMDFIKSKLDSIIESKDSSARKDILKNLDEELHGIVFRKDKNLRTDILRFLIVSDSELKDPTDVLKVMEITAEGIGRKFSDLHEVVGEKNYFHFDMKISYTQTHRDFVSRSLSLEEIEKACREFYTAVLEEDISYYEKLGNSYKNLVENLKIKRKLFEVRRYIPLRIGKHQGFLSTTVGIAVKRKFPDIYSKVYPKLVKKGYEKFPNKSRKVAVDGSDRKSLGWVVIEKLDENKANA